MWVLFCSSLRAAGSPLLERFKTLWMQHLGLWVSDVLGRAGGMVGLMILEGFPIQNGSTVLWLFLHFRSNLVDTTKRVPSCQINT